MPGPTNSYLEALIPRNTGQDVNAQDVSDPSLYLSPEEVDAYNQYQQQQPQGLSGGLPTNAYYPDYNNNIAVGNYSGSQVGSNTIYAPGSALVPLGMMDARDKAVQQAAMSRAADVDKFRNQFKAPTSKLTNINEGLTDEYFNYIHSSWQKALKMSNGDPTKASQILKNDPNFWAKEKSYQDLAKQGDAVAAKIADIDTRVKSGDLMSPALVEAKNRVMMDMNPNSDNFKYLSNSIMRMDADREFSDAAKDVLANVVKSKTGKAFDMSNPDEVRIFKKTVEELDPEAKKYVVDNLQRIYAGSPLYSPDYIERNARALTNYKTTDQDIHVSQKSDSGDSYDDSAVVTQSGEKVASKGQIINSYTEHFVPTNAKDQKQELKISVSSDMVGADGQPVAGGETGYIKGSVQGIGVKPFYKNENRFLTDEEVAVIKKRGDFETTDNIEMRPAVIFNVTTPKIETTDSEGNTVSTPGEQKTVYFNTDKIAGVFKGSKKNTNDYEAMRKKTEAYAKEKNKNRISGAAADQTPSGSKADWIKAGWNESQIQQALKAGKIKVI